MQKIQVQQKEQLQKKLLPQQKIKGKKPNHRFEVNCELPISDNYFVLKDFAQYMSNNIKVEGKKANLGKQVTVTTDSFSVIVSATIPFSKRYLKYLTKKYLKKQDLREYLRAVALNKNTYQLRYLNMNQDEEAAEEK